MDLLPVIRHWTGGPAWGSPQRTPDPVGPDALPGTPGAGEGREPVPDRIVVPATVVSLHSLALGWPVPRWALGAPVQEGLQPRRLERQVADEAQDGHPPAGQDDGLAEGPDDAVSPGPACSYRTITGWLHAGRQWSALRELALHRRVLVLQPPRFPVAASACSGVPLHAHLLWVDGRGVGQVRTLAARWCPAAEDAAVPAWTGWRSWRCHREQTDQGLRLQPSRSQAAGVPLIRLEGEPETLPAGLVPRRDLLVLPDARRLSSWLGTQWSLQLVRMPAGFVPGKEAP
jgi:hypothetical protein